MTPFACDQGGPFSLLLSEIREQVTHLDPQRVGDPPDVEEGGVAFAPLDPADVGAVQPALFGESFLR